MNSVKMLLQIYRPVWKGREFGILGGFFGGVFAFYIELSAKFLRVGWFFFLVKRAITDKNGLL